jgi:hypothetical protein
MSLQKFIRGFIVDPELERKAHQTVDEMGAATRDFRATVKKAERKLDSLRPSEMFTIGALALIAAGFIAGSATATKPQDVARLTE